MPTPDGQDDEDDLRAAVLDGSSGAWRTLFDRHFGPLYGFVLARAGRNRVWAEDVVQETWLIAAKDLHRFAPERGSFFSWLCGIAENQLRNTRRRESRRRTVEFPEGEKSPAQGVDAGERRGTQEGIALTFATLPGRYQEVLRAKYEDQLPTAQIAAQWGATPKSVESLLARAREAFRTVYRQLCGEEENERGMP